MDHYDGFVEHPRYGRGPRYTGIDFATGPVRTLFQGLILFLWGTGEHPHWRIVFEPSRKVPNTGVLADRSKHGNTYSTVTHYFDEIVGCETCGRKFLFFAEEQKHWYEELGFNLAADCRDCPACRKVRHGLRKTQRRYEALHATEARTDEESLEMAEAALDLYEAGIFGPKVTATVRMLMKRCSPETRLTAGFVALFERVSHLPT